VIYRVRVRGKDNGVTSGGVWKPNTETPQDVADCAAMPLGYYNVRCFRVDKAPPASVVNYPPNGSDASMPITVTGNTQDAHSGVGKVFIAICRDQSGGSGVPNTSACLATSDAGAQFNQPLHYFESTQGAWSLDLSAVTSWVNGEYYHVLVRSSDNVNNAEGTLGTPTNGSNHVMFRIISGEASGRIATPSSLNATFPFYKPSSLATIAGTAAGKTHVQLSIKDTDSNLYYDNASPYWIATSTWVPNPTPLAIGGDANWSYPFPGPWRVNHNYTVSLRVCDEALTACSGVMDSKTFVIDSTAPAMNFTAPSATAHKSGDLDSVSAQITDVSAPGQSASMNPAGVYFRVIRLKDSPNKEWNILASTFVPAPGDNLPAADMGAGLFSYTTTYLSSRLMFEDGFEYSVQVVGADRAGNSDNLTSPAFRWDVTAPTAAVTVPARGVTANQISTIKGTAADPNPNPGNAYSAGTGVAGVQVSIQKYNGYCFSGLNFGQSCPYWLDADFYAQTGTWTYTNANLDNISDDESGPYIVVARARDGANNYQSVFQADLSSVPVVVDRQVPTVSITQPSLQYYTPKGAADTGVHGLADDALINGTSAGLLTAGNQGLDVHLWYLTDRKSVV
jgi:hypothetical protein